MTIPLGLWIDCPPSRATKEAYWNVLQELGIKTAAIMIDTMGTGWDLRWTTENIETAAKLALERDIELVLTTWPTPDCRDIDAMVEDMRSLLLCGASAWEVDCEHLWRAKHVRGFPGLRDAGVYLADAMRSICDPLDVRLELTTHGGHRESGKDAQLSPLMDRLVVQAYSVRHRQGELVAWDDRHGPKREQHRVIKRAHGVPNLDITGGPRLSVGLAIWDQKWPGRTREEAFSLAVETATDYGPVELRLWSSKWLLGSRRQDWIIEDLRSRAA